MTSYSEKLKDVRWQKKRLEVLNRDNWLCVKCRQGGDDGGVCLHVHHSYYSKGCDPWEYPLQSLTTLCADCHEKEPISFEHFSQKILETATKDGFNSMDLFLILEIMSELSDIGKHDRRDILCDLKRYLFLKYVITAEDKAKLGEWGVE